MIGDKKKLPLEQLKSPVEFRLDRNLGEDAAPLLPDGRHHQKKSGHGFGRGHKRSEE